MFRMTSRFAFRSAAIAGITSALLLALASTGVHAGPPPNPFPVNCKFDGTFFPPTSPGAGGAGTSDVLSTALGDCKGMGQVNLTKLNPSLLLKYSDRPVLDPFATSGRASMALLEELIATAQIVGRC